MSTIVLAHGLFGFGDVLPGILNHLLPFHYFNRLADHLRHDLRLNVFEPQTNPIGSIEDRAAQLAEEIKQNNLSDPLHIIAHSMGGLDARFLINNLEVGKRVTTLVTVGTPHCGSPVADAIANPVDPLMADIPAFLLNVLHKNAGAIGDLTTGACAKFNANTPDLLSRVRYFEIAGIAPKDDSENLLLSLAARIGQIKGDNDGVVTVASARRPGRELFATWPVDHLGEIGWSTTTLNLWRPFRRGAAIQEHLRRYDAIIAAIMPEVKAAAAGSQA